MPTITASTMILIPDATTFPSTFSARKEVRAPQRERYEHEARQRGQLELQHADEQLHGQDEEADDDDDPGDEQHSDRVDVGEHIWETGELADLGQHGLAGLHPDLG